MMSARLSLPLLYFLLAGCSGVAERSVCGESFCLPKGAKLISRESPVEDFILYRVEDNGERFLIYEGNAPQRAPGSVVLTVGKDWPNFVEVNGPCASNDNCAVKVFAAKIVVR